MDKKLSTRLIEEVNRMAEEKINIMEVCGTHTQMISKLGLKSALSPRIKLMSGPGCPVCVTDESYIDKAIKILRKYDVTIACFGDMMKVRGRNGNLSEEKAKGRDVRIIYSPLDLIEMARKDEAKNIVFLGVGFETTAPIIALVIKTAANKGIPNLFFLTSIKLMPPVISHMFKQSDIKIDGMICPGHVATVKGSDYFRFISEEYAIPAAIGGFEAEDILLSIYFLVKKITQKRREGSTSFTGDDICANLYKRCVRPRGNQAANKLMEEVFKVSNGEWRGIGKIKSSSLVVREKYDCYDAERVFETEVYNIGSGSDLGNEPSEETTDNYRITACECSDILLGRKEPGECTLFKSICNPLTPCGPCMVSSEGACAVAHRYG